MKTVVVFQGGGALGAFAAGAWEVLTQQADLRGAGLIAPPARRSAPSTPPSWRTTAATTTAAPVPCSRIAYRAINLLQLGKLEPPALDGIRIAEWQRVVREPLPEDGVSGQFDYSPQRIERLIEEGRQAAQRAIERPGRTGVAEVRSARARR